jgi:DNA topoisomerase-2
MVLVNGSEGIGTGWSSNVPNYNPRDIIANLKWLLNNEPVEPMDPWYKGFKVSTLTFFCYSFTLALSTNKCFIAANFLFMTWQGSIEKTIKTTGVSYTITGIIEAVNDTKLRISELPVRRWTDCYKEFLESMCAESGKEKDKDKGKDKNKDKNKNKDKDKEKNKEKEPPFLEVVNHKIIPSLVHIVPS